MCRSGSLNQQPEPEFLDEIDSRKPDRSPHLKKALIIGISGQDGAYLAKLLLLKGYEVYGTSRDAAINKFDNLKKLKIEQSIKILSMSVVDFRSILQVVTKIYPDEIYNLSGQTSVGLSFSQPVEANESINLATLNLLEVIRYVNPEINYFNAGSSEMYGDTGHAPAIENTPYRPQSPYAVAKAAASMQVAVYRNAYGLNACTGILFNHESPLRPERFVTKKITAHIQKILDGSSEKLYLGNIEIIRDWGWAPEYVEAMWLMLQKDSKEDYIIASGDSISLREFLATAFGEADLDWMEFVRIDKDLFRTSDPNIIRANPSKAALELGWRAKTQPLEVAKKMIHCELEVNQKKTGTS